MSEAVNVLKTQTLLEQARLFAGKIAKLGFKPSQTIAIATRDNLQSAYCLVAARYLEANLLPINIRLSKEQIVDILEISKPDLLLVDAEFVSVYKDYNPVVISELPEAKSLDNKESNYSIILSTSGSSAKPKLCKLSSISLEMSAKSIGAVLEMNNNDVVLLSLPLYHVGGIGMVLRTVISDANIVIPKNFSAESLLQNLSEFPISIVSMVPAQLKSLLEQDLFPKSLKKIHLGGQALSEDLISRSKHLPIISSYGMTEFCSTVAFSKDSHEFLELLPDVKALIVNDNQVAQLMIPGEICLNSTFEFKYLNAEPKFFKANKESYFMTGDIGCLDEHNRLKVIGRLGRMFKSGGEKIHPEYIEQQIEEIPGVKVVAVIPETDSQWGQRPLAFIEVLAGYDKNLVKTSVFDKLLGLNRVKSIYFLEVIPRTAIGKIDYQALNMLDLSGIR